MTDNGKILIGKGEWTKLLWSAKPTLTFSILILNGTAVCGLLDAVILLHIQAAACNHNQQFEKWSIFTDLASHTLLAQLSIVSSRAKRANEQENQITNTLATRGNLYPTEKLIIHLNLQITPIMILYVCQIIVSVRKNVSEVKCHIS